MKHLSFLGLLLSLSSVTWAAFGCTRSPVPAPRTAAGPTPTATVATTAGGKPMLVATSPHISPPRPAPPIIRVPMPGAPDERALAEARLVSTSCEDANGAASRQAKLRIEQMTKELDAQFRRWKESQRGCWSGGAGYGSGRGRLGGGGAYPASPPRMMAPASKAAGAGDHLLSAGSGMKSGSPVTISETKRESAAPARAESASGTNEQVVGVDEADIVKNDGRYVYIAMNGALRIIEALRPRVLSVTKLGGNVREMFIEGDRAVVYVAEGGNGRPRCTYGYDCQFSGDGSSTKVLVLDVTDHENPRIVRQIDLTGSLMAARRIGRAVHTVVADSDSDGPRHGTWPPDLQWCGEKESQAKAKFKRLKEETTKKILASITLPVIRDHGREKPLCDNLLTTPLADGGVYTTVVSFDVRDDAAPAVTSTLQSRPGAVFASADALYLATVHHKGVNTRGWYSFYSSTDEVSDIHKFRISERPLDTRYIGSGAVPGHVLNQFAMDEYYGYLRIATTRGRVPNPNVDSAVSILAQGENGNLVRVGAVEGLAPGEDIRAVRFDDDRGYVVTFKKTDPLFVLDLYHPARPAVLGELKIPGFSTYMHRIDPDHLMSIGFDADDKGSFAYFDGIILQLFDVSKPTEPKLLHKEKLGSRGSSSEAATNHLAFNYFAERGLLAVPITLCEGGGDGRFGNQLAFSGLLVYGVSVDKGFTRLGGVDHGTKGANCSAWWSRANSQVKRSIFLDDLVYSIATDRAKVQRMGHFGEDIADIALVP